MSLSRKRRRELKRLRSHAEELLDEQRIVLGHAGSVLQEAGRQAKILGDEVVAPRVAGAYEVVRPGVERGIGAARRAANRVRTVSAPFVAAALANTVRTLEQMENPDAAKQLRSYGERVGLMPRKKRLGAGGIVAIGLGVAAAAGVGYTLWQAFRTDDELWVAPDDTLAAE